MIVAERFREIVRLNGVEDRRLSWRFAASLHNLPEVPQDILNAPADQLQFFGAPALGAQRRELLRQTLQVVPICVPLVPL